MRLVSRQLLRRHSWLAPSLLGVGFVLLGIFADLMETAVSGRGLSLRTLGGNSLAGLVWAALTFGATLLARRVPWEPARSRRFFAVHLTAALAASVALNAAYFAVHLALGDLPLRRFLPATVAGSLRWLHLNAGAYAFVVATVHYLDGRAPFGRPSPASPPPLQPSSTEPALVVPTGSGGHVRLPWDEISHIEAAGDYVRIHAGERSHLVSLRMKDLEEGLAGSPLVRIHRSTIVNAEHVREVRHRSHGDCEATLADATVVRVSRTRRRELLRRLAASATPSTTRST